MDILQRTVPNISTPFQPLETAKAETKPRTDLYKEGKEVTRAGLRFILLLFYVSLQHMINDNADI